MSRSIGVTLTYFLRHHPEKINLEMDSQGWVSTEQLIAGIDRLDSMDQLLRITKEDEKGRFEFSDDFTKIRCTQGHSVKHVQIDFESLCPPDILYHGTDVKNLNAILVQGLTKQNRNLVHLSNDFTTAEKVGSRRRAICRVLYIRAKDMHLAGYRIFRSTNGVWLTEHVPPEFISAGKPV